MTIEDILDFRHKVDEIKKAWLAYVDDGQLPDPNIIRKEILDSWIRSHKSGLDPYHISLRHISPEVLRRKQLQCKDLLEATAPLFRSFCDFTNDPLFRLDIYDADLYFIGTYGLDSRTVKRRKRYAYPGLWKDESVCGTSAMCIAKQTKNPVRLIGAEHYDSNSHELICTCVPIFSPDGEMLGLINLVEELTLAALNRMNIMIVFGKGVEYNLLQMRKQEQLIKSHNFSKAILEEIDEAIVVVDTDGSVIMMNKTASALLGMSRGNADDDSMRIAADCNIDHFLGTSNYFRQVLNEGTPVINKEWLLYVGDATQRCIGTVRPIFAENAAMQGAIGTFRDMRSTKKVLKHFGWNASFTFDNVIGSSPALMAAVELAKQTAHLMNNTLLQGESGTGKEIFAQSIHNESHLKKGPFVAVNCAAIPTSLLESELFGYEKGAYTGAKKNGQAGKFELAEGGTIFLDEINSVPLDMQAKLLRVLQEKTVTRVGGTVSISLNLKIIAACNADLKDMVSKGLFRQDLYYRLNVITINIPPLRERIDDIRLLAENILLRKSSENQSDLGLSDAALEILKGYHWPGNVRELENLLERAYVRAIILKSNKIDPGILSFSPELFPDMPMPNKKSAQSVHLRTEECEAPRLQPLKCHEENTIYKAFASNRWNISRTAKALGISRNTLYRKMKSYQIEIPK